MGGLVSDCGQTLETGTRSGARIIKKPAAGPMWSPPPIRLVSRSTVSRVLFPAASRGCVRAATIPLRRMSPSAFGAASRPHRATYPPGAIADHDGLASVSRHERPGIFGLAAGGVCPATDVTTGAVRSYRTFSPLPVDCRMPTAKCRLRIDSQLELGSRQSAIHAAVYFLWHFPSDSRAIARTFLRPGVTRRRVLRSSDFPHPGCPERDRLIGRDTLVIIRADHRRGAEIAEEIRGS